MSNDFVLQSIEKALADLPALPNVVMRVLEETEKPSASAVNVEKLIASDQALASKVLRVVNSAYYGLSGQVSTLSQAIVILGMKQVRNLVLSVAAMGALKPKTSRQSEVLKLFWLHSLTAAAAGNFVAERKGLPSKDVETLFVAGLLHDIGRLFLFCTFTQTYDQVIAFSTEKGVVVERAEEQLLGMNHGGIGAKMAKQWHLPEVLCSLIETHEGPLEASAGAMSFILHYADQKTKYLYFPNSKQAPTCMDPNAAAWIGFSEEQEAEMQAEIDKRIEGASALFGVAA